MSIDPLTWAKAHEQTSRDLIGEAARNPGMDPCDDAFTAAACLGILLDHEREIAKRLPITIEALREGETYADDYDYAKAFNAGIDAVLDLLKRLTDVRT